MQIINGDCLKVLKTFPENSIDAIVTDPPYGLAFMGKKWDYDVPSVEVWAECLRVLKPGGHLLAFAGPRTQHRMAVKIEDAGFEIRDMIAWVYGCLDEQTQLVTPNGPSPYHTAKVGDPVLCYNVETREYNYQPIQDVVVYDYSDTAYRLIGDFGEQVVSRNHRVIVERGGKEVFEFAENVARQQQARIPVLESLPALQQAFYDVQPSAGSTKQDMQPRLSGCSDWGGEQRRDSTGRPERPVCEVCGLRSGSVEAGCVAEEGEATHLQQGMQWSFEGCRVEASRAERPKALAGGIRGCVERAHDRPNQPSVEGWPNLPETEGGIRRPADQVCTLPSIVHGDGEERWLRYGASADCCSAGSQGVDQGRMCTPSESRRNRQPDAKSNVVCNQCRPQEIRAWAGHKTAMVRVVPFHYTGKVWCLRVPTGAFVAVRNGVAFPTGNSGFPKSLDVSKAIDKAAGAEREVVGQQVRKNDRDANSLKMGRVSDVFDITAPATPAARQWSGWGTALKPALETVTFASKPYTAEQERDIILSNLIRLEARLWLLSSASAAEKNSTSNPSEYGEACAIAQWSADEITSTRAALCDPMGTSLFELATNTSLNIVSSWRRTLVESWSDGNTSIIETKSSTTTDLRTLRFSLSQITPESIIKACSLPGGFSANATTAESHFNASLLLLQSIRTLSATEPAISQAQHEHLGAGVKPNLDPCIMARKPLVGTVAENVMEHGTGR